MNHDYQKVVELAQELGIDESYIGKALKDYGYNEFPKSGLEDAGLTKLVKTAVDIHHSEANLIQRKPKKGYLPVSKIKKEKSSRNLESQIVKEDLEKFKKVGRGILKGITYPTMGINLAFPTLIRKAHDWDYADWMGVDDGPSRYRQFWSILGFVIESAVGYALLSRDNPKIIPYIAGVQIVTNLASGIYEYVRNGKNKVKRNRSNITERQIAIRERCYKMNDCKSCNNPQCVYCRSSSD